MKKNTKEARIRRVPVSLANVRHAAARLIPAGTLVTAEIEYVQRTLGTSATQDDLDAAVVAVRKMPWASVYSED